MQVGKVIGTATATVKHPSLTGRKLMLVQFFGVDGTTPDGDPLLAVDTMGAAVGQQVILSSDGRGTREIIGDRRTPVRWTVMGICD